jgi:hypothetical protein
MDNKLIERIRIWNEIKYPNDNETRIIFTTLKPAIDYTIVWKDGTKTFQNEDGTVTTAPKYK